MLGKAGSGKDFMSHVVCACVVLSALAGIGVSKAVTAVLTAALSH